MMSSAGRSGGPHCAFFPRSRSLPLHRGRSRSQFPRRCEPEPSSRVRYARLQRARTSAQRRFPPAARGRASGRLLDQFYAIPAPVNTLPLEKIGINFQLPLILPTVVIYPQRRNVQRHLTSARTHRAFRASAVNTWRAAVAVA
jgi:hypothetical protein